MEDEQCRDETGHSGFQHAGVAARDGKKKVITGVKPGPKWYRPDANTPTYTITAVLDGRTETEAELVKKGLAGADK